MKTKLALIWVLTLVSTSICASLATVQSSDPLPSWNQGKAKQSLLSLVRKTTTLGSSHEKKR